MQVVVDFRTFGQGEAHSREDVDNLVLHDGQRMARAKAHRVGGACQVKVVLAVGLSLHLFLQFVDTLLCQLLQFIDFDADDLFLVSGYIAEVGHQLGDFTLLAEVLQTQLFYFVGVLCRNGAHFLEQAFNLLEYHND